MPTLQNTTGSEDSAIEKLATFIDLLTNASSHWDSVQSALTSLDEKVTSLTDQLNAKTEECEQLQAALDTTRNERDAFEDGLRAALQEKQGQESLVQQLTDICANAAAEFRIMEDRLHSIDGASALRTAPGIGH